MLCGDLAKFSHGGHYLGICEVWACVRERFFRTAGSPCLGARPSVYTANSFLKVKPPASQLFESYFLNDALSYEDIDFTLNALENVADSL